MRGLGKMTSISVTGSALRKLVNDLRVQKYKTAKREISIMLSHFTHNQEMISLLVSMYGEDMIMDRFKTINDAIEHDDWILMADLMEEVCIPAIESVTIQDDERQETGDYILEKSLSGLMTIKSRISESYLHSTIDPLEEAFQLANDIYDPSLRGYIVWGCGLGYFADVLGSLTDGSVPIRVYDEDEVLIKIATDYWGADFDKKRNVTFIYDPDAIRLTSEMARHTDYGLMMHLPSIKKIKKTKIREVLLDYYYSKYEPYRRFLPFLKRNYYSNRSLGIEYVDALENEIGGREVIVVSAGPSLDDTIDYLREKKDRVTIAVGTIFRKLLDMSIIPDYCAFLDPHEAIYKQIDGLTDAGVPLILGVSAYWKIGYDYRGKRYLAMTKGINGVQDAYSDVKYIFEVGNSVTTLAIDIAMQMGASAIYLVGSDLAYGKGISHASGTPDISFADEADLIPVQGVSGDTVYTTGVLNNTRRWIENEIRKYPQIPVYNLSRSGAYIAGTK